jgi:hypothetical protein
LVGCFGIIWRMTKTTKLAFGPGIIVQGVAFRGNRWVVSAEGKEADHVRAAEKLPDRGIVGRCDGCRSFQFREFLRRWRFALAAGDVAMSSVFERRSPKRWRSRYRHDARAPAPDQRNRRRVSVVD